jgi:AraC-like DNA-binding protein
MQLAIYDLIGALFGPSDPVPASVHTEKLFKRIRGSINEHFADPGFGPREVAADARISLRYLQKLFAAQNSTCSNFIDSVRLGHAARLLLRRKMLGTRQPISEIAYACGFADHANFARKFRRCFGHTPGSHSGDPAQTRADPSSDANTAAANIVHSAFIEVLRIVVISISCLSYSWALSERVVFLGVCHRISRPDDIATE